MNIKSATNVHTRLLKMESGQPAVFKRGTGPLDYLVPWVIELRVMGTAAVIPVEVHHTVTVGRADPRQGYRPEVDLEAYDAHNKGVSRQHVQIAARNSQVTICDQYSANGTSLNGGRLLPGREYRLMHGDILVLGHLQLQVAFVLMPSSHEKYETIFRDIEIPVIGTGQRVLVTEEDVCVAQTISNVLEQAGFSVMTTTSIDNALLAVRTESPQAVVTELMLGDRSGFELIDHLREMNDQVLPIVVLTSAAGGYQMARALEAGISIFLTKPVGVDELLSSFASILPEMTR